MNNGNKTVLFGSSGMLGQDLLAACRERNGCELRAFADRSAIDLVDEATLTETLGRLRPTVIINAAAYTDVDAAEHHRDETERINHKVPGMLARLARDLDALLVHFSTDHVFNGKSARSYRPDDSADPINWYGQTKFHGEEAIRAEGCRHLIIRSSWLFAAQGRNFVQQILEEARTAATLHAEVDQRGCPTRTRDLADITCRLVSDGAMGTFHVANQGDCTRYEFAEAILGFAGLNCELLPVRTEDHPRPARRPRFSVLDLTATSERVGRPPHWRDALADCVKVISEESSDEFAGQTVLACT